VKAISAKNRIALTALAVVLVISTIVSAWQAVHANSRAAAEWQLRLAESLRRQSAEASLQQAQQAAAQTQSILEFLHHELLLCGELSGNVDLRPDITLKEAVDHAVAAIPSEFADQPLVAAALRHEFGEAYQRLGENELAAPQFEQALAIRSAQHGRNHRSTIASLNNLAIAHGHLDRIDLALPLLEEAYSSMTGIRGPDDPLALVIANNLAQAYSKAARPKDAFELLTKILPIQSAKFGENHPTTVVIRSNLNTARAEMAGSANGVPQPTNQPLPAVTAM